MKLKRLQHPTCLEHGCSAPATRAYLYAAGAESLHYRCEKHLPQTADGFAGYLRLRADEPPKSTSEGQLDLPGCSAPTQRERTR